MSRTLSDRGHKLGKNKKNIFFFYVSPYTIILQLPETYRRLVQAISCVYAQNIQISLELTENY